MNSWIDDGDFEPGSASRDYYDSSEISMLEQKLASLESKRAIYGFGGGNEGYEMLAMNNDQEIERVRSRLSELRGRGRSRRYPMSSYDNLDDHLDN